MRIRLPADSRTAQSRTPYGCSIGTCLAPLVTCQILPRRSRVCLAPLAFELIYGLTGAHAPDQYGCRLSISVKVDLS
jgi:hypothetical protein